MARVGERGSVVSFIVVGVLLTALVVGGIIGIKHLNQPQEVAVDSNEQELEKDDSATKDTPKENTQSKDQASEKDKQKDKKEQEVAQSTADQDEQASDDTAKDDDSMPVTGQQLPQTGPSEWLATGGVVALVAGSIVAYRRSLRV